MKQQMKNIFNLLLFLLVTVCAVPAWGQHGISIIHGPYLQNVGPDEATIVWVTDKPSVGWIEMAPDDNSNFYAQERNKLFDTHIGIKRTSTIHVVKVGGLQSGTRYRYRVCAQEVLEHKGHQVIYGKITATDVYNKAPLSFVTLDSSKATVSFAMVNDIHGDNDRLEKMVGQCDLKQTDLFLFNGDMVSVVQDQEQLFGGFMDKAVELFASSIPAYYCRGNHETRGPMAPYFKDYFNPKEEELYYMFRQGPVCFVVLDCGEDKPDSDVEYYGITAYDEYRTRQTQWLEKALESDLYRNAPFKVIVCHMPPFGGWHGELDIARKFIPLLNEAKPDVYLTAHLHQYIRRGVGEEGVAFPLIVNSDKTLLKAQVDQNRLDIRIYDLDGKEIDHLVIEK